MQHKKSAIATSKRIEKFDYLSINDEKKAAATSVLCYMEHSKYFDENVTFG